MPARPRTFRLFVALLAATMLFGNTLPLVQHAYAMALHGHRDIGGFDLAMAHHAAAMPHHASPASSDESRPCHNADDGEQHPATTGPCCFLKAAAQANTMAALVHSAEVAPTALLSAKPLVLPEPAVYQPAGFWFDTGPPRAHPIALHLLHAAFLI